MAYASITKPSLHFNTKIYAGNGSTQNITGVGFQPDWVWIKNRSDSRKHNLYDAVRGVTKRIVTNDTAAEDTASNGLTAFGTDGFTTGSEQDTNHNGNNFVSWNWKANGQGSSNTDGTINTTYTSANTTAGFSICKWSGSGSAGTIGHGLGAVPKMIIAKRLTGGVRNWPIYHHRLGNDKKLYLNDTQTESSSTNWNSTTPTSSVFSVGSADDINGSGSTYIAYCFAEKTGYSKFGSYTGNGNTDGTFVYTGFKPAFVMIKNHTTGTYSWTINDTARTPHNVMDKWLYPNINNAEATGSSYNMDLLSNGFKSRNTGSNTNDANNGYIYMAFAEEPLVANVGNGIPATAR